VHWYEPCADRAAGNIKETHMAQTEKDTTDENRKQQPGAQGAGMEGDAVKPDGELDDKKLKRNQERLGVDEEHKTPEMRKEHRGTFP
jgi:hypothetical protein